MNEPITTTPQTTSSQLPSSLTTITPFSKLLALFLLIFLPLVGFYLGMVYQKTSQVTSSGGYYVAKGRQCSTAFYTCPTGLERFHDFIGCGCQKATFSSTTQPPTVTPMPTDTQSLYNNSQLNITFILPVDMVARDTDLGGEGEGSIPAVNVESKSGENWSIYIIRELNPQNLSPLQWYNQNQRDYHELFQPIAQVSIDGNPTAIYGQPNSCKTVTLLVAFIKHDQYIYEFSYSAFRDHEPGPIIHPAQTILQTLTFSNNPLAVTSNIVNDSDVTIPPAPSSFICP